MSKYKVKVLTTPDEVKLVKPENMEVTHCASCGERVALEIKEREPRKIIPTIKKKEPKEVYDIAKEEIPEYEEPKKDLGKIIRENSVYPERTRPREVEKIDPNLEIKEEPTIEEVKEQVNKELEPDLEPPKKYEMDEIKAFIPTPQTIIPDVIRHEHNIKISLPAMIFSTLSLIIMVLLLKFM